jgi:hypothetical protein
VTEFDLKQKALQRMTLVQSLNFWWLRGRRGAALFRKFFWKFIFISLLNLKQNHCSANGPPSG